MKRINRIEIDFQCKKRLNTSIYELYKHRYTEEKKIVKSVETNPYFKIGIERLRKIAKGFFQSPYITNMQYDNFEHIQPTTNHLIFPEIYDRFSDEIAKLIGCYHNKKCGLLVSDRGTGKTFTGLLYISHLVLNVPAKGDEYALMGEQELHAKNLLCAIVKIINSIDTKNIFDKPPRITKKRMVIYKNGNTTTFICFPGRGEAFRGRNDKTKYIWLDEALFIDPSYTNERVLPHFMRHDIGGYLTSTRNVAGHRSEVYLKQTKLIEYKETERICKDCKNNPNWEEMKKCIHVVDAPEQPNQDEGMREVMGEYLSAEALARELYGLRYRSSEYLFDEMNIDRFFEIKKVNIYPNFYVISIDPNLDGDSENATVIFGVKVLNSRMYICEYLNSFGSNDPQVKLDNFKMDLEYFVNNINIHRIKTRIFVESNTNNMGLDLNRWIMNKGFKHFMRIVHCKKWNKRLNKFDNFGYATTNKRKLHYVDTLSKYIKTTIFNKDGNVYFSENIKTNTNFRFNSIDVQLRKLKTQIKRFKIKKGKISGKETESGSKANDDLALAFMAGITMSEEFEDPKNDFFRQSRVYYNN